MLAEQAQLVVDMRLNDRFTPGIAKAQTGLKGLTAQAKGASQQFLAGLGLPVALGPMAAFTVGATALTGVLVSAVSAAINEQANIAKLGAALRANVRDWDGTTDAIERTISAREALAFSDDDLRDSLAQLVTFTHDVDEAFRLQSAAMDLARLKGLDLTTASELIGKVYSGNVAILRRYGIAIREGADRTEALAAVQKLAAGQARAYADTAGGKLATAQIRLNDAMEELGTALLPVVSGLADLASDVLPIVGAQFAAMAKPIGDVVNFLVALERKAEELGATVDRTVGRDVVNDFMNLNRIILTGGLILLPDAAGKAGLALEDLSRQAGLTTDAADETSGAVIDLGQKMADALAEVRRLDAAGDDLADTMTGALAVGIGAGVRGMLRLDSTTERARKELQGLVDDLDIAKGSFHEFWQGVQADQRRIRYFITHPDKLQTEVDRITGKLEGLNRRRARITKDGIDETERLTVLGIDRLIAKLTGQLGKFRALGLLQGNAEETGFEQGFHPRPASVPVDVRWNIQPINRAPPVPRIHNHISAYQTHRETTRVTGHHRARDNSF